MASRETNSASSSLFLCAIKPLSSSWNCAGATTSSRFDVLVREFPALTAAAPSAPAKPQYSNSGKTNALVRALPPFFVHVLSMVSVRGYSFCPAAWFGILRLPRLGNQPVEKPVQLTILQPEFLVQRA